MPVENGSSGGSWTASSARPVGRSTVNAPLPPTGHLLPHRRAAPGILSPLTLALLLIVAVGAGAGPAAGADVAVILSADVDAYRQSLQGFKATLQHRIVSEFDMDGNFDRGRELITQIRTKVKPDLILAVGVWALQLVSSEKIDRPVVYAMVLNPPSVLGPDAKNITGASMNVPVEQSIRLFKQLGQQIQKVGIVFDRTKTGYLVQRARDVARQEGLLLVAKEIRSPREVIPALESLQAEGIDALWLLPDEAVLAPPVVQHMLLLSYRRNIPVLGLHESQARMGALLSLSFASSEDIGRQAGELANKVLSGTAPAELPYTTARRLHLAVNLKAAQKIGMAIPRSILERADAVIQ